MIEVVLADDQAMFNDALAALLEAEGDIRVVAQARTGEEAVRAILAHKPDVALVDIEMGGMSGLEVASALQGTSSPTALVIVTTFRAPGYVKTALECGVKAFLTKDEDAVEVARCIRRVVQGEVVVADELLRESATLPANPLTTRQQEVLRLTLDGQSVQQIAARLSLSRGTVKNYLSSAIQALGAASRVDAARMARDRGWLLAGRRAP